MTPTAVLHCITGLDVGGAEYMLARYLGVLDRRKFPSDVLSLMAPGPLRKRITDLDSKLYSLGMCEGRLQIANILKLRRVVRHAKPNLVHGWMYHGNLAASIGSLTSLRFAPVVWSIHHSVADIAMEKPLTQRLIRLLAWLSSGTRAISYCSQVSAEDHERLGFDPRRRVVIHNGIDCDEFRPSGEAKPRLARLLGVPLERHIIGHVGRAHPMKDQANLIRAVANLIRQGYNLQCVVIGAGHEDGVVRQTARELGVESRVSTLGLRSDVPALMPGLDVFALSSAWGETFSLAAGEAMASCVPAVVTNVGDCALLVGDTGKTVPPGDNAALTAALANILDLTPEARRALGSRARRRVIENFSLQQYAIKHQALYEAALAHSPPTQPSAQNQTDPTREVHQSRPLLEIQHMATAAPIYHGTSPTRLAGTVDRVG